LFLVLQFYLGYLILELLSWSLLYNLHMTKHKHILDQLKSSLASDKNNTALLVTGSVARNEQTDHSDLDLLLISKEKQPFKEELIDEIVVETKTNTLEGFIEKMKADPMNVYQWLDANIIFDKDNSSEELIREAKNIYEGYSPDPKEIAGVRKWIE